jgi:Tol biopolymer transport system component
MSELTQADIREQHSRMLAEINERESDPDFVEEVEDFIDEVREAGKQTPRPADRYALRTIASFWAGWVYDHSEKGVYPNAELYPSELPVPFELPSWAVPVGIGVGATALFIALLVLALNTLAGPSVGPFTNVIAAPPTGTIAPEEEAAETSLPLTREAMSATPPGAEETPAIVQGPVQEPLPALTITSPGFDEQVRPVQVVRGTFANLVPGSTIYVLLEQDGVLRPASGGFAVPTEGEGEWSLEVTFGQGDDLPQAARYTIYPVVAINDEQRQLIEKAPPDGWSELPTGVLPFPSGVRVTRGAFQLVEGLAVVYSEYDVSQKNYDLWLTWEDRRGRQVYRLTETPEFDEFEPAISPDGGRILYTVLPIVEEPDALRQGSVWLMNSDGSNSRQLVGGAEIDARWPAWSPDAACGCFLYVQGESFVASHHVMLYTLGAPQATQQLTSLPADHRSPGWLDGKTILFTRTTQRDEEYVWQVFALGLGDGEGDAKMVIPDDLPFPPSRLPQVVPSPDGARVAFTGLSPELPPDSTDYDIFVLRLGDEAANAKQITFENEGPDEWPTWAPDGRQIVYSSRRLGQEALDLYTISPTGVDPRPLFALPAVGERVQPDVGEVQVYLPLEEAVAE